MACNTCDSLDEWLWPLLLELVILQKISLFCRALPRACSHCFQRDDMLSFLEIPESEWESVMERELLIVACYAVHIFQSYGVIL